jgi:hypothetical protein
VQHLHAPAKDDPLVNGNPIFNEFLRLYGPGAGVGATTRLVREVFGAEPDEWQIETMNEFDRGNRHISIRSCHGPGKTALLAWLILAMLLTRFPQKTVATAPSKGQLEDALVTEVLMWAQKLPPALLLLFEFKKNRIELRAAPEESFFSARTAREENPEALQGIHSKNVLLIADEASGVPEKIFEAAVGSMSGENAITVLASNPVRTTGFFFDTHNRMKHAWWTMKVSAFDSPRVSCAFVKEVAEQYGEDSDAYRVRVLGEFPAGDRNTIIPYELLASAQERDILQPPNASEIWGLDVARFGDDTTTLLRRTRLGLLPNVMEWSKENLMTTAGRVKHEWDILPPSKRPEEILVDVIGMGAGVVDRLRELGLPARGINVSETKSVDDKYRNLRTELWFKAKAWLEGRDRFLPKGPLVDKMIAELASVEYSFTSSGKMWAQPKDDVKKKIRRSPNLADAFCLTFASDMATLISGASSGRGGWTSNWRQPLSRDLGVV